jgi:hypothetical protein
MALEGNVKDFGLSEIFQLIALQKKSGMLSVTAEETMVVFFREGMLISTRDRRNELRDPLKDYLINYGFLERDEIDRMEKIQAETGMDLAEILLREKYFSEDELSTIFIEQMQETMQEVLSWPRCYYKFNIGNQILQGVKSFASLKVEGVLMESMRRIDEFPELLRIFPSEEMGVKRLTQSTDEPPELDKQEEIIYEMLESEVRIGHLISTAKMPRFCTYEALKNLLEKGLLEIGEKPAEREEKVEVSVAPVRKEKKRSFVPTFAIVLFLLISFAIGEYLIPYILPPGWNATTFEVTAEAAPTGTRLCAASLHELKLRLIGASLRQGIEEHRALTGSYPITLEILAVRNIIPASLIDDAQKYGFVYRSLDAGGSYSLTRNQ